MKTPARPYIPPPPLGVLLTAGLVLHAFCLPLRGASSAAVEAKNHTLFMGADFSIQWQGKLRPVETVTGSSFVVVVDGKRVVIPSSRTDLSVKMDKALKVTARSAAIDELKAERAYTAARDPMRKITDSIAMRLTADAAQELADANLRAAEATSGWAAAHPAGPDPVPQPLDGTSVAGELDAVQSSGQLGGSLLASSADAVGQVATDDARAEFDAFRLSLQVSSSRPLAEPYLIVVTRYQEDPERADSHRIWIYAEALARVEAKPSTVRLFKGGFRPGYKLEEVEVHLYDRGQEIATNVSPKRVPLSLDEAMLFLSVEYCAAHPHEDLAPSLAIVDVPPAVRAEAARVQGSSPLWAKIATDGRVAALFADEAGVRPVSDEALLSAVKLLRYKPALKQGKPVEAMTRLKLADVSAPF